MNKHQKLMALGALTSAALWIVSAGTTAATGAETGTEQPLCGMISSTHFTAGFIPGTDSSGSATGAAEAVLEDPRVPGETPSGDAETVAVEGDSARVAITDSGEVSHLVEVEQAPDGEWYAESVNECLDGAFSEGEVSAAAVNTPWYTGVWHNNVTANYRIANNVPAGWNAAVQAGVANYSNRAAGNGPEFLYMGTVASTNDGYACDNSTNLIYADPTLPYIGLTNKCFERPDDPRQTTYISRMQITMLMGPPGGWYTGSGDPGIQWDLQSIVTHEAGHATGFHGHFADNSYKCPVPRTSETATMCEGNPGIQGSSWLRTLTDRDITTINEAY